MKKPTKSFEIVLSAISCAVAAGALTAGSYVNFLYAAGIIIAVFALMIPLSKDFYWGASLAFLGSALLTFLFYGFSIFKLVPYLTFFGIHPIINRVQLKFVKKKWLHALIEVAKAVWFDLAAWLSFALLAVNIFGLNETVWYDWVMQYFHLVLWIGGTVAFLLYDIMTFLCQRSADLLIKRIRR